MIFAHLYKCAESGITNEAIVLHSSSVTGSKCLVNLQSCEKVMGWCTAQCKMLPFCAKAIVKESRNFELEEGKEMILAAW